jgi:hypothetical protein
MDLFDSISEDLSAAAAKKLVSWDAVNAIQTILGLEVKIGDHKPDSDEGKRLRNELVLVCRLLGGGADPATLAYLRDGKVSELIASAHVNGPGVFALDHPERDGYLTLCGLSEDECQASTARTRVLRFAESLMYLGALGNDRKTGAWSETQLLAAATDAEDEYLRLPYAVAKIGGVDMRVYTGDGGHAAGVWDRSDPQTRTAVYGMHNGEPYLAIGVPPYHPGLAEQGVDPAISPEKQFTPRYWIVEDPDVVEVARLALEAAGHDYPGKVTA